MPLFVPFWHSGQSSGTGSTYTTPNVPGGRLNNVVLQLGALFSGNGQSNGTGSMCAPASPCGVQGAKLGSNWPLVPRTG